MTERIVYTAFGDPDVLTVVETDAPTPGPGELLVRVEAAGVNPIDAKLRSGKKQKLM